MDDVTTFESSFEATGCDAEGGLQRLDVIPAGVVRRRWTGEAKARIVTESLMAGANVSAVARRHGIVPQQLYAWRRLLGERIEADGAAAFVPVRIEAAPGGGSGAASGDAEIRIEHGAMRVFVPAGASAEHVGRVLLAMRVGS